MPKIVVSKNTNLPKIAYIKIEEYPFEALSHACSKGCM